MNHLSNQVKKLNITVYCASSPEIKNTYFEACKQLAIGLSKIKSRISYGGGAIGLMGTLADTVIENGGEIRGIIPDFMIEREWQHPKVEDMHIVESMHERKAEMLKHCDIAITLPGGCGTFEEFMEALTWRRLDIFHGRLMILNLDNYYDPLIQMLEKAIEENFMPSECSQFWEVYSCPKELLNAI